MSARTVRAGFAACIALAVAALPHPGRAADPFPIYAIVPATGSAAFLGKGVATSLSVLQQSVNDAGGINGRPITFVTLDDQSNPQIAVQLANGLIAKGVPVILGSVTAASCNAVESITKSGPVTYCYSSATSPVTGGYMFAANPSTHALFVAAARYLRERHWTKVAFITATNATGQNDDLNFDEVFRAKDSGLDVVAYEHFTAGDISVAAQIARIKASGAQVLLSWVVGTPFATVLHGAFDAGLEMPIMTSGGNLTYAQMDAYASFLPKELYFTGFPAFAPDQLPNGPTKQAVQKFIAALKTVGVQPEIGESVAWDPAVLVVDAYRKLGFNATAPQVRDYIAGLRGWQGINGTFDFAAIPQRGVGEGSVVIEQWNAAARTWVGVTKPKF